MKHISGMAVSQTLNVLNNKVRYYLIDWAQLDYILVEILSKCNRNVMQCNKRTKPECSMSGLEFSNAILHNEMAQD